MKRTLLALASVLALGASVSAQEDGAAELKKRIMERVRTKLAQERAAFLKRVEQIIDEEYAREPEPAPPAAKAEPGLDELERKLRALKEQEEILKEKLARKKRMASDEDVIRQAKKEGPHTLQQSAEMFRTGIRFHEAKKFQESVRIFKRIYYRFPGHEIGVISAYNVACGYALTDEAERALDWLEISVEKGYNDFDHMRKDPDLDSLRGNKRYKRLLLDR